MGVRDLYDVIVIGGGPVGSYMAYKLAGAGYKVVVLEQEEKVRERICCTGIVGKECIRSFDIISDDVILKRVNSARIFSPSGKLLRLWREEVQACILDRAAFDVLMASRAIERGAEYIYNSRVRDIEVQGDIINAETTNKVINKFKARAAVIASGFGSRLIETLDRGQAGDYVIGAQAEVEAVELEEVEVYSGQNIAPGFFAWLVPTSQNRALVGLLSRRNPRPYLIKFMSSLKAQGKIATAGTEIILGGIRIGMLPKTYGERIVAVGGVAGQVKPITGGGIYYGLLCADIAASNLQRALEENDLSAKSLAGYEREWKRKLKRELMIAYYARKFFEHLSDGQIDRIFDIISSSGIDKALLKANDLSFDWHGKAVLRLAGHKILSSALEVMKIPFYVGGKNLED